MNRFRAKAPLLRGAARAHGGSMHNAPAVDPQKLEAFVMRAIGDLTVGYTGIMVSLGTRLGLYKAMAGAGPISARELATRTGCAERYLREWLNAQAAGGYLGYHAISDTYELSPEQAMVLADEDSPYYVPPAWNVPAAMWADEEKSIAAFRTGAGVAWGERDGRLACGVAAFYRNGYKASLVPQWLPALDGVVAQLEAGITVADVGCGHGHSTLLMAQAFPRSRFHGYDTHEPSIAEARRRDAVQPDLRGAALTGPDRAKASRASAISGRWRCAQIASWVTGSSSVRPSGVSAYSTPGGFVGSTVRASRPSRSRLRSARVNMRCEMPASARFRSLKRSGPSPRLTMTSTLHVSPTRVRISRVAGQSSAKRGVRVPLPSTLNVPPCGLLARYATNGAA
jgi:hypothetical protein